MLSSAFVISFVPEGSSVTSTGNDSDNTTQEQPKEFIPSVWPWMYDPSNPDSLERVIPPCDKWVLQPWVGFTYHEPAIKYKEAIIGRAWQQLPGKYAQAQQQFAQESINYLNYLDQFYAAQQAKQEQAKSQQIRKTTYNGTNEEKSLNIVLATTGVANTSYSATSSSGVSNPYSELTIFFSEYNNDPPVDTDTDPDPDPYAPPFDFGKPCPPINWEVGYEGYPQWEWQLGEVYEQWKDPTPTNWIMGGGNDLLPAPNVKAFMHPFSRSEELPVFMMAEPAYLEEPYNAPYKMEDLNDVWDRIVTSTNTIEVKELCKLWHEPNPINPLPVPSERFTKRPEKFPLELKNKEFYLKISVGYKPPDLQAFAVVSSRYGTEINITPHLKYLPAENDNEDGKLYIEPFDISSYLKSALSSNGGIPYSMWSQNGMHTLEIIVLGIWFRAKSYDKRKRAREKDISASSPPIFYVPSLDKGDYLYRKRWAVLNGDDQDRQGYAILTRYVKKFGKVGLKRVVDIYNPYNKGVTFFYIPNTGTDETLHWPFASDAIPVKVAANSIRRVTLYGESNNSDEVNCLYLVDSDAIAGLEDLKPVKGEEVVWPMIGGSKAVHHIPYTFHATEDGAVDDDPPENTVQALNHRFPIFSNKYYDSHGIMSGQRCTCELYSYNPSTGKEELMKGSEEAFLRLGGKSLARYMDRNKAAGSLYAWISPDIKNVWKHNKDAERPFQPFDALYTEAPLGGAVEIFCENGDKTNETQIAMCDTQNLANFMVTITITCNDAHEELYREVEHEMLDLCNDDTDEDTWDGNINTKKFAAYIAFNPHNLSGSMWNTGQWCEPFDYTKNYYRLKNIQSDVTTATMQAVMVGRVKDGWDNKPIKVHIPDMGYMKPA